MKRTLIKLTKLAALIWVAVYSPILGAVSVIFLLLMFSPRTRKGTNSTANTTAELNPANGLPMDGEVDILGNPYGCD